MGTYKTGDLVKRTRYGENVVGLITREATERTVNVMWETGTMTEEFEDDIVLIADSRNSRKYLIEGKKHE